MSNEKTIVVEGQRGMVIQDALITAVQRTDIDPERLERFLDLQIKMEERQQRIEYQKDMAGFQSECPIIKRKKNVNFKQTNFNYAPIEDMISQIQHLLVRYGLSYKFKIKPVDANLHALETSIMHKSGYVDTSEVQYTPVHDDARMNMAQRRKSAISYAKRIGLENALGLVTIDDDRDGGEPVANQDLFSNQKIDHSGLVQAFMGLGVSEGDIVDLYGLGDIGELTEEMVKDLRGVYKEIKDGNLAPTDYFLAGKEVDENE